MGPNRKRRRTTTSTTTTVFKLVEVSQDEFKTQLESDMQMLMSTVVQQIALLDQLQFAWEVNSDDDGKIVIRPKEQEIDETQLFYQSVREEDSSTTFASPEVYYGPPPPDPSGNFDYEDSVTSNNDLVIDAKFDLDSIPRSIVDIPSTAATVSSHRPLPRKWPKPKEPAEPEKIKTLIGIDRPIPKMHISKKTLIFKEALTTVEVIREDPENAVPRLRDYFLKSIVKNLPKTKSGEDLRRNPSWTVRIVAALYFDGEASTSQIDETVRKKFQLTKKKIGKRLDFDDLLRSNLTNLLAAGVIVFVSEKEAQIFKLSPTIIDDGSTENKMTKKIAARIARVFHRRMFLGVIYEAQEVLSILDKNHSHEMANLSFWNAEFPDPTVGQMVLASIVLQGNPDGYVHFDDIKAFFQDCFLEREMNEEEKNELVATLNSLYSIGVLIGNPDGYQLSDNLECVEDMVLNMTTSELFDLCPPPMFITTSDMLILAIYILNPLRTNVNTKKVWTFMTSHMSNYYMSKSTVTTKTLKEWDSKLAWGEGIFNGVVRIYSKFATLTEGMFMSLDRHFREMDDEALPTYFPNEIDGGSGVLPMKVDAATENDFIPTEETKLSRTHSNSREEINDSETQTPMRTPVNRGSDSALKTLTNDESDSAPTAEKIESASQPLTDEGNDSVLQPLTERDHRAPDPLGITGDESNSGPTAEKIESATRPVTDEGNDTVLQPLMARDHRAPDPLGLTNDSNASPSSSRANLPVPVSSNNYTLVNPLLIAGSDTPTLYDSYIPMETQRDIQPNTASLRQNGHFDDNGDLPYST